MDTQPEDRHASGGDMVRALKAAIPEAAVNYRDSFGIQCLSW